MSITLIDKIVPKNDAFVGLVDAKQVIGGVGNVLLAETMPAFTGDVTSASGSVANTLATVNSNVGSFTNANITVNAKGLITAASNGSGGGSGMVYPGAGIAVSTGSAWATPITDNSTNWNTAYSSRITSATLPLSITSNVISIAKATTSVDGYLSATDWNTFNGKQTALGFTPYNATNPSGYTSNVGDVTLTGTQTLTNKTLTSPVISTISNTGTITVPTTTGTLALTSQITGTNSGTNTGDQTITLTGGVTGSGTGSFAATVVTNANLTGVVTSTGNATAIADAALSIAKTSGLQTALDAKGVGTVTSVTSANGAATIATTTTTPIITIVSAPILTTARTIAGVSFNGSANITIAATNLSDTALLARLASPVFSGTPSLPTGATAITQSAGNSSTALATTAFVTTADNLKANLASPTFTGTVVLPNSQALVTPVLGTPTSVTLTNATGLPIAGLVNSTSAALGLGTIELGHATDTTLSRSAAGVLAVEGVVIPSISSTNTLTNKRITRRVVTVTQAAAPAMNTDNMDIAQITGLAQAITSMTTNLTGTPAAGDYLTVQITDNGTARAITWGASFASGTANLPTTTEANVMLRVGFQRNHANTIWDCIAAPIPASGSGDMVLASAQTNTGAKTFNATTLLLRNVANTFNGSFTNTNTADRIYTLQNRAGTLSDDTDLALKANLISPSFTTPTLGVATATRLGVGVAADASKLLLVKGDVAGGVATLERTNASTTQAVGTVIIKGTSTGDMVDGFGSAFQFAIQDTAAVENIVGSVQVVRDGGDTNGKMYLVTHNAGTPYIGLSIDTNSDVRIGYPGTNTASVATLGATQSLTNKRIQPRTNSSTTASTLAPDLSSANVYYRTTQTATLTVSAPVGTPVIGETIMIYIDSAAAQTLTMNATYKAFGAAFPATTTAGKTLMISAQWNGTNWATLWSIAI